MLELILGGQKSGKSARAEQLAAAWLAINTAHRVVFIATAQALDAEMHQRIARHQSDRAMRLAAAITVEEPLELAAAITRHSHTHTLIIVDCMTLWVCNWLMPAATLNAPSQDCFPAQQQALLSALHGATGPVVVVSNEIGLGVIPLGQSVRAYVDALGGLNQALARVCQTVTFMSAGLALTLKQGA